MTFLVDELFRILLPDMKEEPLSEFEDEDLIMDENLNTKLDIPCEVINDDTVTENAVKSTYFKEKGNESCKSINEDPSSFDKFNTLNLEKCYEGGTSRKWDSQKICSSSNTNPKSSSCSNEYKYKDAIASLCHVRPKIGNKQSKICTCTKVSGRPFISRGPTLSNSTNLTECLSCSSGKTQSTARRDKVSRKSFLPGKKKCSTLKSKSRPCPLSKKKALPSKQSKIDEYFYMCKPCPKSKKISCDYGKKKIISSKDVYIEGYKVSRGDMSNGYSVPSCSSSNEARDPLKIDQTLVFQRTSKYSKSKEYYNHIVSALSKSITPGPKSKKEKTVQKLLLLAEELSTDKVTKSEGGSANMEEGLQELVEPKRGNVDFERAASSLSSKSSDEFLPVSDQCPHQHKLDGRLATYHISSNILRVYCPNCSEYYVMSLLS